MSLTFSPNSKFFQTLAEIEIILLRNIRSPNLIINGERRFDYHVKILASGVVKLLKNPATYTTF